MNTKMFATVWVILLLATGVCLADRQLDRSETLQILQSLTAQPHKTWIPAGTILAAHEEYKAAVAKDPNRIAEKIRLPEEFRMITDVIVRFDGERFYWQIDVVPGSNLPKSEPNLKNNIAAEQFDLNANGSRIFVWDGQKYSTYFRPANSAIIKDAEKIRVPHVVNGPLTAGFIPWGFGNYSYEKLSAATSWATERVTDNQKQIQLILNYSNGFEMCFLIDPDKNYAILSHQTKKPDNSITLNTYGNFQLIGDRWIPTTIMLEQYKDIIAPQNLATSDLWNFTSINNSMPAEGSFKIDYENDALIEYHAQIEAKPVMYRYSKVALASGGIDSDSLLIDKFDIDTATVDISHNCATAAIKYAVSKFGKNLDGPQLAQIPQSTNGTSLYAMKQFIQSKGLYCRAVRTDAQALRSLSNCQTILHLSGKNHYVVLGNIDDTYIRVIDLTNRKFFDRLAIDEFTEEWIGIALLISDQPINGQMFDIDDAALHGIVGTGYTCSKLLQGEGTFYCSAQISGTCGGTYSEYMERWGCAYALTGTCNTSMMPKYQETVCVIDIYDPLSCTVTGEWKVYYMRACN